MVTLKDIAAETGLRPETVSRVLNNRGYISEATREKVIQAVKRLHYTPNESARALVKKTGNTVALIVPQLINPFFSTMVSQLSRQASEQKLQLLVFNSEADEKQFQKCPLIALQNQIRGIILMSVSVSPSLVRKCLPDLPIVMLECRYSGFPSVLCDNESGGYTAAMHLIERGCRHLAYVNGVQKYPMPADSRLNGFMRACEEKGVDCRQYISGPDSFISMNYTGVLESVAAQPQTDGIVAGNDVIAAQTVRLFSRMGRKIPQDLKVIGFDGTYLAGVTQPSVTSMKQPYEDMAAAALQIILSHQEDTRIFQFRLIPGESTQQAE